MTWQSRVSWVQNQGSHFESWSAGISGPVTLEGLGRGTRDLSWQKWSYKVCRVRTSAYALQFFFFLFIWFLGVHIFHSQVRFWIPDRPQGRVHESALAEFSSVGQLDAPIHRDAETAASNLVQGIDPLQLHTDLRSSATVISEGCPCNSIRSYDRVRFLLGHDQVETERSSQTGSVTPSCEPLAGLFRCTNGRGATSLGHGKHGERSGVDQWAEHWKVLDGCSQGRMRRMQLLRHLPAREMPISMRKPDSTLVRTR